MRLLLTGATGFLGRRLKAAAYAHSVFHVSRATQPAGEGEIAMGHGFWTAAQFAEALRASRPDVVVHCAGDTSASSSQGCFEANAALAAELLEACLAADPRPRAIVIGSAAEYGPVPAERQPVKETWPCSPASLYGVAKHAQTLLALSALRRGLPVLVVRLFNAVGVGMPQHLALPSFARRIARAAPGSTLRVGDLSARRDFIDVDEAARLLLVLAQSERWPWPVVNLCSGRSYQMSDLLDEMIKVSGVTVRLEVDEGLKRKNEASILVGEPGRLLAMGMSAAPPDFSILLPQMLAEAKAQAYHGPGEKAHG